MKYRDQHCHSEFSFDSRESIENYLKLAQDDIVTTEHLDYDGPWNSSFLFDYEAYHKKIQLINEHSPFKVLKGIELGYASHSKEKLRAFLKDKSFDLKLLSIHEKDQYYDFMNPIFMEQIDQKEALIAYYEACAEAIENFPEFHVFTHIDCPFRAMDYHSDFDPIIDDYIPTVLRNLIDSEMCLELNTRSLFQYENLEYYRKVIKIYQKMGGKLYSLGSDAHIKEMYRFRFDQALQLMHDLDIKYLSQFKDGKRKEIEI